jgi:hypothetical protein
MRRGLYNYNRAGAHLLSAAESAGASPVIEQYLGDRCLDPPALALFHGDRALTLADHGAAGHAALITQCAATASFARMSAVASGLDSGMLARLPRALLDAAVGSLRIGPQVYSGLAIGHAAEPGQGTEVIW